MNFRRCIAVKSWVGKVGSKFRAECYQISPYLSEQHRFKSGSECATSIQRFHRPASIIAQRRIVGDFFNSIDPKATCVALNSLYGLWATGRSNTPRCRDAVWYRPGCLWRGA
jgi:hypothetical protein